MEFRITPLEKIPPELQTLLDESVGEGFRFLERLSSDWQSGINRFDKKGERFWAIYEDGNPAGVCGLNQDPFLPADEKAGRLRHLYVARRFRRRGIGRALIKEVLLFAEQYFKRLTLRTDTEGAAHFYESLGFRRTSGVVNATHLLTLGDTRFTDRRSRRSVSLSRSL